MAAIALSAGTGGSDGNRNWFTSPGPTRAGDRRAAEFETTTAFVVAIAPSSIVRIEAPAAVGTMRHRTSLVAGRCTGSVSMRRLLSARIESDGADARAGDAGSRSVTVTTAGKPGSRPA